MQLTIIDAEEVRRILAMPTCIDLMETAMRAVSSDQVATPPRLFAPVAGSGATLALMPGSTQLLNAYGAKIITVHPDNKAKGIPVIQGFIVLFDHATGNPAALVEGSSVTAIRTAAASGLATRVLARDDATSHGILGTGVQAASHIDAISVVREIRKVVVWGRNRDAAQEFAKAQADRTGRDVVASDDPRVVARCDIVTAVTASAEPIVEGAWLCPGAHVNLVGSHAAGKREADSDLIANGLVYVDSRESALSEAGDILIPIVEGRIEPEHIVGEIGECLDGRVRGRADGDEITVYKSLGTVAQDLFAAEYILKAHEAINPECVSE